MPSWRSWAIMPLVVVVLRGARRRPGPSARARRRPPRRDDAGGATASGSPSRCRAASRSGRSDTRPGLRVLALQPARPRPGRARARTAAGRRAPSQRSPTRSVASSSGQARSKASTQLGVAGPGRRSSSGASWPRRRPRRSSTLSSRIVSSASQTWSRASLCGVPGSGASKASAQSSALSQTSAHGVSTSMPCGRRLLVEPDGRLDRRRPWRPTPSAGPPPGRPRRRRRRPRATRSRRVQVCTPSSPRLGSTSAT